MSRGGKAPVGGGGGERRAMASARSYRRAADEGREPRAPGMDALQDAEPAEVRELELKPVQGGIARGVPRRRPPLHLERLLHSLPAAVLRHLGLLARLARRHGGRSRVSRGAAWSGASPTSSSRVRSRSAEARRLRVTPKRGAARRAAAPMRENLGPRDETTRSGSSRLANARRSFGPGTRKFSTCLSSCRSPLNARGERSRVLSPAAVKMRRAR